MSDLAIRVISVGKKYRIGVAQERYPTLRDALVGAVKAPFQRLARLGQPATDNTFWALKDVSFEVARGEVVGIIGRNGAGKSTLLKLLSRITKPTEGRVEIYGRVGSLLEVGTGFHAELTGRENIYLNGAILGMKKAEIDRKFDEIVAFAEIDRLLDTPVKHYSSGMYLRLAFAVAAHLEPEILLVDEVLAVGDIIFQKKCLGKMGDVAKQGRTVLFVSHNMAMIQSLCNRAYLLTGGFVSASGSVNAVVSRYLETMQTGRIQPLSEMVDRQGNGRLRIVNFSAYGPDRQSPAICGSPAAFIFEYKGDASLRNVSISVSFYTLLGEKALFLCNELVGKELDELPDRGAFVCRFDKLPLIPNTYTANVYCTVNGVLADWIIDGIRLEVGEGDYFGTGKLPQRGYGSVVVMHDWNIEPF